MSPRSFLAELALSGLVCALLLPGPLVGAGRNELLITDLVEGGSIWIYEYRDGAYQPIWSTITPGLEVYRGGGEAGDLTGDGVNEIVLVTAPASRAVDPTLQIWSYDAQEDEWFLLWAKSVAGQLSWSVGDIADVDRDGRNELLVTNDASARLELYSYDGNGFTAETVRMCSEARYMATAGDLDGDGTPEILFQCTRNEDLVIQEHDGTGFPVVGSVTPPPSLPGPAATRSMFIDDMETGDVNGDGRADAVFCGNSGRVHVITFDLSQRRYVIEYSSPAPARSDSFSQTCSIGDITNDGVADILVVTQEGARVYSHDGAGYGEVWSGPSSATPIGGSFVGDADNDGHDEFLYPNAFADAMLLYESDVVGATSFTNTVSFGPLTFAGGSILIGDLRPEPGSSPPDPGPQPLNAPQDLLATVRSTDEVLLSWTDNAVDEDGYRVESRAGSGGFAEVQSLPAGASEAVISGLVAGNRYAFRVRAWRGGSFSGYSNRATVKMPAGDPPAAPSVVSVEATSTTAIRLRWSGDPDAAIHVERRSPAEDWTEVASSPGSAGELLLPGLAVETPYTFRLRAVNAFGASPYSAEAHATTLGAQGPCRDDGAHLCLLGGRFEVKVQWRNPRAPFAHGVGTARAVPASEQTGMFWFFGPENVELVVKMLDAGEINGFFWHFYGALSDVEYWISVRDTREGRQRTYHNPPFEICGGADTRSFVHDTEATHDDALLAGRIAMLPAPSEASGACIPGDSVLCLHEGRFEVTVEWRNPRKENESGQGRTLPELATADTGFFWFFVDGNVELAVKILDGRAVNGRFWFFWGALSDVEYTLRVRDTTSGSEASFHNEPYSLCGGADIDVF